MLELWLHELASGGSSVRPLHEHGLILHKAVISRDGHIVPQAVLLADKRLVEHRCHFSGRFGWDFLDLLEVVQKCHCIQFLQIFVAVVGHVSTTEDAELFCLMVIR